MGGDVKQVKQPVVGPFEHEATMGSFWKVLPVSPKPARETDIIPTIRLPGMLL